MVDKYLGGTGYGPDLEPVNSNNPQPIPGVRVNTRPSEPIKKLGFSDAGKQARYEAWKKAHGK
jgi:hypothetical protein